MFEFFIIFFGSIVIVYYSRLSLTKPYSHGFFRFFAWEIILILFSINRVGWFLNALSWHQMVSWFLLTASIFTLIAGVYFLKRYGKSAESFESTTQLVRTGIFRFIRHPLYASLFFLAWGIFFKSPSWLDASLVMISSIFLYATARADEKECMTKFGNDYALYMRSTKRFIPYLF